MRSNSVNPVAATVKNGGIARFKVITEEWAERTKMYGQMQHRRRSIATTPR